MISDYKLYAPDITMNASMPFKHRTYVCFNPKTDIHYYRVMLTWQHGDGSGFDFYHAQDLDNLNHTALSEIKKQNEASLPICQIFHITGKWRFTSYDRFLPVGNRAGPFDGHPHYCSVHHRTAPH